LTAQIKQIVAFRYNLLIKSSDEFLQFLTQEYGPENTGNQTDLYSRFRFTQVQADSDFDTAAEEKTAAEEIVIALDFSESDIEESTKAVRNVIQKIEASLLKKALFNQILSVDVSEDILRTRLRGLLPEELIAALNTLYQEWSSVNADFTGRESDYNSFDVPDDFINDLTGRVQSDILESDLQKTDSELIREYKQLARNIANPESVDAADMQKTLERLNSVSGALLQRTSGDIPASEVIAVQSAKSVSQTLLEKSLQHFMLIAKPNSSYRLVMDARFIEPEEAEGIQEMVQDAQKALTEFSENNSVQIALDVVSEIPVGDNSIVLSRQDSLSDVIRSSESGGEQSVVINLSGDTVSEGFDQIVSELIESDEAPNMAFVGNGDRLHAAAIGVAVLSQRFTSENPDPSKPILAASENMDSADAITLIAQRFEEKVNFIKFTLESVFDFITERIKTLASTLTSA
ncbi:MAG: hypothetical protein KC649_04775, partial [Candidatus Omnitrophica bacterium]|nr:hypothetical protein [Candidatus Omnitrophota bacterium]